MNTMKFISKKERISAAAQWLLFDLCEECYDKWIGGFKIPVEIQK